MDRGGHNGRGPWGQGQGSWIMCVCVRVGGRGVVMEGVHQHLQNAGTRGLSAGLARNRKSAPHQCRIRGHCVGSAAGGTNGAHVDLGCAGQRALVNGNSDGVWSARGRESSVVAHPTAHTQRIPTIDATGTEQQAAWGRTLYTGNIWVGGRGCTNLRPHCERQGMGTQCPRPLHFQCTREQPQGA